MWMFYRTFLFIVILDFSHRGHRGSSVSLQAIFMRQRDFMIIKIIVQ